MTNKERTFYHATWSGNVDSIQKKGIVPKKLENADKIVDTILAEYGESRETVPKYYWHYPLLRLQETADEVYISGDRDYAICNCLAGFEAETQLRSHLEARRKKKKFKYLTTEEALKREMPCSVCNIKLKENEIPREQMEEFKDRAKTLAVWSPDKFKTEQEALDYILSKVTLVLNKKGIPKERITKCEFVGREEDFVKCGLRSE